MDVRSAAMSDMAASRRHTSVASVRSWAPRTQLGLTVAIVGFWCVAAIAIGPWRARWMSEPQQISRIFEVWETSPAREHLFLPFYDLQLFADRVPYTHFPPVFILLLYAYVRMVEAVLAVPVTVAQNFVFLPYALLFAGVVVWLLCTEKQQPPLGARGLLVSFVSAGVVATNASFWTGFVLGNVNFHVIAATLFLPLGVLAFRGWLYSRAGFLILLVLALLAPLYALFGLLACALLYDEQAITPRRTVVKAGACLVLVTLVSAFLPVAVFHLGSFVREGGSSIGLRSGLDGDTRYFANMITAVLWPYPGARQAHALHLPALALLAWVALRALAPQHDLARRMLRLWLVAVSPYFIHLVFFPQAIAIHPYLFDVLLTAPSGFALAFWSRLPEITERLEGSLLLTWFLVCSGIIMTSLIDISRAWRALLE